MPEGSILIGVPSASGHIPIETVGSLLHMRKPLPYRFIGTARTPTDIARNLIVHAALEGGYSWLLFVDDDVVAPADALTLMLDADRDIVCAPYPTRRVLANGRRGLCASYRNGNGYQAISQWREPGPLHQIDVGGCGVMLIRRHVLTTLNDRHPRGIFAFGRDGALSINEDRVFCERAAEAGFGIWLHEGVRPAHIAEPELVRWAGELATEDGP